MDRINQELWKKSWQIAKFYWISPDRAKARYSLLILTIVSILSSILLVWETVQRGEIISSLAVRDGDRFWQTLIMMGLIIIVSVPLISFKIYLEARLSLNWRKWLTNKLLTQYLSNQKFYYFSYYSDIDNPDQRIAEDVKNFSKQFLFLFTLLLEAVIQLAAFIGIIWVIYRPLVLFLFGYSILGTSVLFFIFGRVLTKINYEQIKKEADFRFNLIRIREHAESIAFYRGTKIESRQVKGKLVAAIKNFQKFIGWQFGLNTFQNGLQFATILIPTIVLAPSIFNGNIEVGAITQSQSAFERIWLSLSLVIMQFDKLTMLTAEVQRLSSLIANLESSSNYLQNEIDFNPTINSEESSKLSCQDITLITPDFKTELVKDLSLTIERGQKLLIVGKSGVGKSSLILAIAGLWKSGKGTIFQPKSEDILFLSQSPYLTLGSIEKQLIYPYNNQEANEQKLWAILEQINLTSVVKKHGGLEVEKDWSQILSRGEQQRLAFGRLLLYQPNYAILDEATSALDIYNQDLLYQALQTTKITFISVGHRPSLLRYHQQGLELTENQHWCLSQVEDFNFSYI